MKLLALTIDDLPMTLLPKGQGYTGSAIYCGITTTDAPRRPTAGPDAVRALIRRVNAPLQHPITLHVMDGSGFLGIGGSTSMIPYAELIDGALIDRLVEMDATDALQVIEALRWGLRSYQAILKVEQTVAEALADLRSAQALSDPANVAAARAALQGFIDGAFPARAEEVQEL